ncbi:MAG: zf-HC2 domain-containing protein [Nitrospirae bacterium]|nr:zf-HC2 domain-containing protein [Nitrospirota bacterium]
MKRQHDDISELIPDFARNALGEEKANSVREHLQECSDCTLELSIVKGLLHTEVPEPGSRFFNDLKNSVAAEAQKKRQGFLLSWMFSRPLPITGIAGIAGIACCILITVLTLFQANQFTGVSHLLRSDKSISKNIPGNISGNISKNITKDISADITEDTDSAVSGNVLPGDDSAGYASIDDVSPLDENYDDIITVDAEKTKNPFQG